MAIFRVSDALQYSVLNQRLNSLQVQIKGLNDQITTGQRLQTPDQDPVGAAEVVRLNGDLSALGGFDSATQFGHDVLAKQDDDLGQVNDILTRAQEIATEFSSDLSTQDQRDVAASDVHGLLKAVTQLANDTIFGRRLFAALQPDSGAAPFADPDSTGYDPTAAYTGPADPFSIRIASGTGDTVQLTTPGDQVFGSTLVALSDLEDRLRTGAPVNTSITGLEAARNDVEAARASVGVREKTLIDRGDRISAQVVQTKATRSQIADTDMTQAIAQLSQLQLALQAALAAGAQIAQTSLTTLLKL